MHTFAIDRGLPRWSVTPPCRGKFLVFKVQWPMVGSFMLLGAVLLFCD